MSNLYPITYWYGIRPEFLSKERLIEAKEAGFTVIECSYGTETNKKVLKWCEELGLKANVGDPRVGKALAAEEGWEQGLLDMIADYADYPAVNRFFMRDEPLDDYFPTLGRVADFIHTHDPKHGEYINLLPYHAVPPAEGEGFTQRYQRHIDNFFDVVHPTILSYDHYNLKKEEVDSLEGHTPARVSDENRIRNGWEDKKFAAVTTPYYYNNLELIRENAMKRGVPWMDIILLVEHWHYRWPTEAEVRWEAFTALAYGSTALSYFTYWTPGTAHTEPWSYHNGIILSDGTRGEKYEIVKRINADLQALYAGICGEGEMTSEAVCHVGEEADELAKPFAGHGKYTAIYGEDIEGGRLVAGFFAGDKCMLVNKDFEQAVTVTVQTDGKLEKLNKTTGAWEPCGETITL
ncbi:MAG: hypothetical protein IJX72_04315, partial [Clostridia bacterium]|nr:hypothetical protein [Clostridia bacterium]